MDYNQQIIDFQISYDANPEDLIDDYAQLAEAQADANMYGTRSLLFGGFSILTLVVSIVIGKMKVDEPDR